MEPNEKMTEYEICKSYREAKNPNEQVKILAQLNCCSIDDIYMILAANNEPLRKRKYNRTGKPAEKVTTKPKAAPKKTEKQDDKAPDFIIDLVKREYESVTDELEMRRAQIEELSAQQGMLGNYLKKHGVKLL